jgi:hypothetical protein
VEIAFIYCNLSVYEGSAKSNLEGVRWWWWSGEIKGTRSTGSGLFHDVKVDHGGFDVCVSHKRLNHTDVGAGFEQMCRERMAHRVASGTFRNPGLADCILDLALHGGFVQVVAGDPAGVQISSPRQKSVPFHTN